MSPTPPTRDEVLLQEWYAGDPYRLLVSCVLLNCTTRRQVNEVLDEFFDHWPSADDLAIAGIELEICISSLGLQNRRAMTLRKLAEWLVEHEGDEDVHDRMRMMEPPGVGEYARDSWMIFMEGPTDDNVAQAMADGDWPADKELKRWFHSVRIDASAHEDYAEALKQSWAAKLEHVT